MQSAKQEVRELLERHRVRVIGYRDLVDMGALGEARP